MNRDLYITLVFAGGSPETAFLYNQKHTLQAYIGALPTDEYKVFAKRVGDEFVENADNNLMGNLYRAQVALQRVGPEHNNYPKILKSYTDLLKLTQPIVERLSQIRIEASTFEGIELVIE